jgi:hypothetical protein
MTDDENELDKLYRKDGRFRKKDSDRLSLKGVRQAGGEENHSDFTTGAMRYVVPGYQLQEKKEKSDAGSRKTRRKGFWEAALFMVQADPKIKPKAAWKKLPKFEHGPWRFEIDGDDMVQRYHGRDQSTKKSQDWQTLKYEAFRQGYIYEARKTNLAPDK